MIRRWAVTLCPPTGCAPIKPVVSSAVQCAYDTTDFLHNLVRIRSGYAVASASRPHQWGIQIHQAIPALRLAPLHAVEEAPRGGLARRFPLNTVMIVGVFH